MKKKERRLAGLRGQIRITPAFRVMGWLTAGGLVFTLVSWQLSRLMLWLGERQVAESGALVLSRNSIAVTTSLGLLTCFFLAVWILVAVKKL